MHDTARDQVEPRIRQVAFFLPNRIGALRRALTVLDENGVQVGGISVVDGADHAVVRLVVDRPDGAHETLAAEGYGGCVTDLLAVVLPVGPASGIQRVLSVLLGAEVNVEYAYALILQDGGRPVLALQVDDLTMASRVLQRNGFDLLGQDQLTWPERS